MAREILTDDQSAILRKLGFTVDRKTYAILDAQTGDARDHVLAEIKYVDSVPRFLISTRHGKYGSIVINLRCGCSGEDIIDALKKVAESPETDDNKDLKSLLDDGTINLDVL